MCYCVGRGVHFYSALVSKWSICSVKNNFFREGRGGGLGQVERWTKAKISSKTQSLDRKKAIFLRSEKKNETEREVEEISAFFHLSIWRSSPCERVVFIFGFNWLFCQKKWGTLLRTKTHLQSTIFLGRKYPQGHFRKSVASELNIFVNLKIILSESNTSVRSY